MAAYRAGAVPDFDEETRAIIEVEGNEIVVFAHGGRFYAFDNTCLHMGGPVGEGLIIGKTEAVLDDQRRLIYERFSDTEIHIVCPWHGWEYDLETGQAAGDRSLCLRRYETEVRGNDVYVHV